MWKTTLYLSLFFTASTLFSYSLSEDKHPQILVKGGKKAHLRLVEETIVPAIKEKNLEKLRTAFNPNCFAIKSLQGTNPAQPTESSSMALNTWWNQVVVPAPYSASDVVYRDSETTTIYSDKNNFSTYSAKIYIKGICTLRITIQEYDAFTHVLTRGARLIWDTTSIP